MTQSLFNSLFDNMLVPFIAGFGAVALIYIIGGIAYLHNKDRFKGEDDD